MMKEALQQLCDKAGDDHLHVMCEAGEKLMLREKGLYPNLDYYAAPVYWMLGIPIPLCIRLSFSAPERSAYAPTSWSSTLIIAYSARASITRERGI